MLGLAPLQVGKRDEPECGFHPEIYRYCPLVSGTILR